MHVRGTYSPSRVRALQIILPLPLLLAIAVLAVRVTPASSQPVGPETDPIPVIDSLEPEKSVVVELAFDGRTDVDLTTARVVTDLAHGRLGDPPLLRVHTFDHHGGLLQEFNAWHPLWVFGHDENDNERLFILDEATGLITFPFEPNLSSMTVTDVGLEEQVLQADLDPVILEFCDEQSADPECATDLTIAKTNDPDPAFAGESLDYTLTVANVSDNPARGVQVLDTLPDGVTFDSAGSDSRCATGPVANQVLCELDTLATGDTETVAISTDVDADLVYSNGGPVTVTNHATVTFAGDDLNDSNNATVAETTILARVDLEVISLEVLAADAEVLIGEPASITLQASVVNNGPASPTNAALSTGSVTDSGMALSADPANPGDVDHLQVGVPAEVNQAFTLECLEPGVHLLEVTTSIAPAHPDDVDHVAGNDSRTVTLTVECILPVAVNIHPGSDPNPLNLRSMGSAPVAILTTDTGEYGLPAAFDATLIDPASVTFGPRDQLFNTAASGASPRQDRGHLEDAYEPDEVTKDGDLDMILHFPVRDSGLSPGATEACVKGTAVSEPEGIFTFFGCDAIVTRP